MKDRIDPTGTICGSPSKEEVIAHFIPRNPTKKDMETLIKEMRQISSFPYGAERGPVQKKVLDLFADGGYLRPDPLISPPLYPITEFDALDTLKKLEISTRIVVFSLSILGSKQGYARSFLHYKKEKSCR